MTEASRECAKSARLGSRLRGWWWCVGRAAEPFAVLPGRRGGERRSCSCALAKAAAPAPTRSMDHSREAPPAKAAAPAHAKGADAPSASAVLRALPSRTRGLRLVVRVREPACAAVSAHARGAVGRQVHRPARGRARPRCLRVREGRGHRSRPPVVGGLAAPAREGYGGDNPGVALEPAALPWAPTGRALPPEARLVAQPPPRARSPTPRGGRAERASSRPRCRCARRPRCGAQGQSPVASPSATRQPRRCQTSCSWRSRSAPGAPRRRGW